MAAAPGTQSRLVPRPPARLAGQVSFRFYWAHHFPAPPDWTVPSPVRRPYATLWLVLRGELQIQTPEGPRLAGPGTLVAWPPDSDRRAANRTAESVILYTAAFDLRVWGDVDFFRLYRVPTLHRVPDFAPLAQPFSALVDELAASEGAVSLEAEGWARVLVGRWLGRLEAAGELRPAADADERLTAVLAAVEADLTAAWSLQRLADMMRLSKVRMREVFVRGVGLPPMRYIALRRLSRARSLLADTELTCAEIAQRCGFHDPGYFSRIFHRTVGMQPLAYRERARFRPEQE